MDTIATTVDTNLISATGVCKTYQQPDHAGRLVLDLRGLSFIDSTGLHLLVALHQRAQRDGFQLALVAPAAPADRPIHLCGLHETLPFVTADAAVDPDSPSSHHGGTR